MFQRFQLPAIAFASASLGVATGAVLTHRSWLPADVNQAVCAAGKTAMLRLELLFGMQRRDGSSVTDKEWRAFLDSEISPRFPNGLTVLAAHGQWRNQTGAIAAEESRMLVIWSPRSADIDAKVEAIRSTYKQRFDQESVMRVDGMSCVSF
jgi:hypothetical protein